MKENVLWILLLTTLTFCPYLFGQGPGFAWSGPGPSVNVKAFGALGDVQENSDGSASAGGTTLTSSTTFTVADVGKNLWIDQSPFPEPILAGITVSGTCTGGLLANTSTYAYHVYYRITYKSGALGEGNPSVEGFALLPANSSGQCAHITSPGAQLGATNYEVYFAADAPLRWTCNTMYSAGATILDTNGNIEKSNNMGTSNACPNTNEPIWSRQVGQPTADNGITWVNQGPVVPGSGSGSETFQSGATHCNSGNPIINPGVSNCEIDAIQTSGSNPPSVTVFNAGTVTGFTTHTLTFANAIPDSVSAANFAWGHDDTTAITNALSTLTTLPLFPGGTLLFPVSSGCYGITSNISLTSGESFLGFIGEGSASSKQLGGPGTVPGQPSSACIATLLASAGFSFSVPSTFLNAGPIIERLGFLDPFGVTTAALTLNTTASTRIIHNSFQGYATGTAIQFNAGQPNGATPRYNQFVEASDNVCLSVHSCIVMNGGITNPSWIHGNRCVSAQTGGGRCVQLGPNPTSTNGGGTNWVAENFALYFPISFESTDQIQDYWIANSDQETSTAQINIIGSFGTGVGLHIASTPTGSNCFDNEVIGGNAINHNIGTALFIDAPCSSTLYIGYTTPAGVADFGSVSSFWNQEFGMKVSAPSGVNPFTVNNQNGGVAFQVLFGGDLSIPGTTSGAITIHPQAVSGTYNFNLPTSAGSANQPLLSQGGGINAMTFGPLPLGSSSVSGVLPLANGGTNTSSFLAVAGELYNSASAQTNASISAVTMLTVGASDTTYRFDYYMTQVDAGSSCTGNSHVTVNLIFTDPVGGATQPVTQSFAFLSLVPSSLVAGQSNSYTFRAQASHAIQYSTTYTPGTGCSPGPKYQIFPVLEQM